MGLASNSNYQKRLETNDNMSFTIRDTDFLIRMFQSSHISGADISQASSTISKLKAIHDLLSQKAESVF